MTSYWVIFESGSLPPILGKTSTSRANHGTARLGRGSLKARHSQNGRIRDQVRSYGSTGNVSCRPALTYSQRLMPSPFVAGAGKSVLWYAKSSVVLSCGLTIWSVPRSSRRLRLSRNPASHHLPYFSTISARIERSTSLDFSHRCYSSCATSPTPTTISCPLSIQPTPVVHKVPAMTNLSSV